MKNVFDFLSLICCLNRIDYIIAPLKILQSMKDSVTYPDDKYSFVSQLSPDSAKMYQFTDEEVCIPI